MIIEFLELLTLAVILLAFVLVRTPLGPVVCGFWRLRRQAQAKLIDLRAEYIWTDRSGHDFYRYHAWFALTDGKQLRFRVPERTYNALHSGDTGILTHRGSWIQAFHVTQPAADVQAIFKDHE